MKLSDVAAQAGVVGEVVRDGDFKALGKIGHQGKRQMLTFCDDQQYVRAALTSEAVSCLIVPLGFSLTGTHGVLLAEDPRFQFYKIHHFLARQTDFYGVSWPTRIGKNVRIHPTAVIAETNVAIGDDCEIGPYTVVHKGTTIGVHSRLQQQVTLGSAGFEYRPSGDSFLKIEHTGGVMIGDDVDIHSGSVIDRAVYGGYTSIGHGTKLDCGVHMSHNATVGRNCIIGARVSIMGNTTVGDGCRFGPHVVTSNGISIGDGSYISLGSVVTRTVAANTRVTGNFAVEHRLFKSLWDRVRDGEFLPKDT